MTAGGERFLVAPYGEVSWVRNPRAAQDLTLTRRGHVEAFTAQELHGDEAVLALRTYIRSVPVTRAYFDVGADATDAELADEARRHPGFRLAAKH